ncbi:MAG: NAD-dependent epimerase/dehydratase family protein, partial [bacterium]|nr:NAD-dependent epimerase/dehydratase family protein [bacterium]
SATEYPGVAPLPYREDNLWLGPPEPAHAPYTTAKKMLLVQGQAYRKQYGMNVIHLLPTNMYGPGEKDDFVIPMLIKKTNDAKKGGIDFIEVWGTGKPTRDFLYVEDAAEGVVLATEKYDKESPVNLGSGFEVSVKELALLIVRLMDFKGEIRFNTEKPDGEMRRLLDTTFAEKEMGFKALVDLETGLKETIKFHTQ